ncbi:type VII secretion protein EccB [Nocardia sp. NBC_00565]|uniref:type VII secretion protein EccB n=1 Tax=Nocardia sp. NBC_00565 TaxID=2975993 RepID=UPI002E81854B|nr:type VII secretion protein EccB [Nocardia sp. NBC_00565]WUC02914.1 type VII secretion protein EccB [Nocardia sp. NBC_00565]
MPSKPTTRWQVSGYRFLVRRMEHALVRRDVRMLHDPMRSQSRAYAAGLIMAIVVLAGCGVLALLRPQDKIGSSKILIGKESGAVYVVINDVVHPTLNLASARLAAGSPEKASIVKESEIGKKSRGQLIGIPGAPSSLRFDKDGKGRIWTVCDQLKVDGSKDLTTSVLAGPLSLGEKASVMGKDRALLVQGKDSAYLIYDGKRARIDLKERAVTDALKITGATARPIGEGLLNTIPEVLRIIPPHIDNPGGSVAYSISGHRIGDVVQVPTEPDVNYVVLRDGLQPISRVTAEIIRNSNPTTATSSWIEHIERTHADISQALPVGDYPQSAPSLIQTKDDPVSCLSWKPLAAAAENKDGGSRAELTVLTGVALPIPDKAKLVPLAQADGSGANADAVYIPPGTGAFVQTTGIEPDSRRKDSKFYIADTGVRYGIKDADAEKALGMDTDSGTKPEPAPWPIIGLLAAGPSLARADAMVAHDGVAADPSPSKSPVASQN